MTTIRKPKTQPKTQIESLAVKYRPKVFEDLIGQSHLVSQLQGMFKAGRLPGAILLAGQTGTGKTTTARMIARYLNCKNPAPVTHAPCGECISCKYVEGHPDVTELNIGDTRGIDDIRALVASSKNLPVMGESRVFILDECFTPDTEIEISPGEYVTLKHLVENKDIVSVLSFNHLTGEVESTYIVDRWEREASSKNMVEVELEDGSKFPVTENHPWWSVTRGCYVTSSDLQPDEELLLRQP